MLEMFVTFAAIVGLYLFSQHTEKGQAMSVKARAVTAGVAAFLLGWINYSFLSGVLVAAISAAAVAILSNVITKRADS